MTYGFGAALNGLEKYTQERAAAKVWRGPKRSTFRLQVLMEVFREPVKASNQENA